MCSIASLFRSNYAWAITYDKRAYYREHGCPARCIQKEWKNTFYYFTLPRDHFKSAFAIKE